MRHNTARPNILAADQPQPVDPLLIGQVEGFCDVVHVRRLRVDTTIALQATKVGRREQADRAAFRKQKLQECEIIYVKLAKRLKKHGFKTEVEASITNKLKRESLPAACAGRFGFGWRGLGRVLELYFWLQEATSGYQ